MSRAALVLAGIMIFPSCRGQSVQTTEPEPSVPATPGEAEAEPTLWLEAEHFEDVPPPPLEPDPGVAPLAGFEGEPVNWRLDRDGLERTDYALGDGPEAGPGAQLTLDYLGTLADGTSFDSTYDRATPFEFELGAGRVIPGFERGLEGARAGMRRKLVIPPELAYGDQQRGQIPANATLIFYIEVLSVE